MLSEEDSDRVFAQGLEAWFGLIAASAALNNDASQLEYILETARLRDWYFIGDLVTRSAIRLAGDDRVLRDRVLELAEIESGDIVYPMCEWLDASHPSERAVLQSFAESRIPAFATLARKRLAATGGTEWWRGVFTSDPTAGLQGKALAAAQKRIAPLVELLSKDGQVDPARLIKVVMALPERAALAAGFLQIQRLRDEGDIARLLEFLLRLPGAHAPFLDHYLSNRPYLDFRYQNALKSLKGPAGKKTRHGVALAALARLGDSPFKEKDVLGPVSRLHALVCDNWPPDADIDVLVDRLKRWGDPDATAPVTGHGRWWTLLGGVSAKRTLAYLDVFRQALDADFCRGFDLLGPAFTQATDRWPAKLRRELAISVLDRPDAVHTVSWAVGVLADLDDPVLFQRIDDARVRRAALNESSPRVLAWMRQLLRDGSPTLAEAGQIFWRLAPAWGGASIDHLFASFGERRRGRSRREEVDPSDTKKLTALFRKRGQSALAGPINAEEWDVLYRLREAASDAELVKAHHATWMLPTTPWTERDFAWTRRLVRLARDHAPDHADWAARAVALHPSVAALELIDSLEGLGSESDQDTVAEAAAYVRSAIAAAGGDVSPEPAATAGADDDW